MKLHWLNHRYMKPADDAGTGGGAVDRGDDFTPVDDDAAEAAAKAAVDAAAAKQVEDDAKAKASVDELAAKAAAKTDGAKTDGNVVVDDDEETKKAKAKDTRLPLARHKEILDKERERREAVERELATYKKGELAVDTSKKITEAEAELLTLEEAHAKAVTDGEAKKAAELMAKIRTTERGIIETRSTFNIQAAETRAYERVRYDTTVERLEAAYPVINPDHKDFDEDLAKEMVELRDGYIGTGRYSRAEALQKAAKVLLGTDTKKQADAVTTEVRVLEDDVQKQVAADRKAAATKKAADAAAVTPPSTAKVGVDSDKMGSGQLKPADVIKMKHDDFAKLDEATLARLRGDELV